MYTDYDFIQEVNNEGITPEEGCLGCLAAIALLLIVILAITFLELLKQ